MNCADERSLQAAYGGNLASLFELLTDSELHFAGSRHSKGHGGYTLDIGSRSNYVNDPLDQLRRLASTC
jgi:hypothetical protein